MSLDARLSRRRALAASAAIVVGLGAAPARAQPRRGGEVVVGTLGDIYSFDGYQYGDLNYVHQRLFYDHLIDYDYKLNPMPSGLTAWTMAPDHLSATLKMQPGITLHSGRPWKVSDLLQSFDRAANPKEGLQLLGPMAPVASWSAADDSTVVMKFKEPISDSVLTDLLVTMPVTDADKNSIAKVLSAPAGGGPFKLVSRSPNDAVELARFPAYWRPGKPSFDRVTIKIFDNADAMVAALESGAITMINVFSPNDAARLRSRFTLVEGYEGALGDVFRFNPLRPPYDNVKLRLAIARAVDRERIAREVYAGYATPCYLPWVRPSVGFEDGYKERLGYDLGLAAQLWKEAGSPASVQIMTDGNVPTTLKAIQIVQSDLRKIGFDLQIDPVDTATFGRRGIGGDFGVFYANIGNVGKRSPSAVTTNSFMRVANNVVWKDKLPPEYVEAMRKVRTAPSHDAERAACSELNTIIAERCWFVPVVLKRTLTAMEKTVVGVTRDTDDRLSLLDASFGA